jgi:hypothetical protein
MRKFTTAVVVLVGAMAAASALAQDNPPAREGSGMMQQGTPGGMMQMMPQQGTPGGMMGCPMMQRMASLDERLKRLEERSGVPMPSQPDAPATPR